MQVLNIKMTDYFDGIVLLNIAARGTLGVCEDRDIEVPTTTKELDERLVSLPNRTGDKAPFFLWDKGARERFFTFYKVDSRYHEHPTSELDEICRQVRFQELTNVNRMIQLLSDIREAL